MTERGAVFTQRLCACLPDFLSSCRELRRIFEALGEELALADQARERGLWNLFPRLADEAGISRYEELLQLQGTGDLEERRSQVLARLTGRREVTPAETVLFCRLLGLPDPQLRMDGFTLQISFPGHYGYPPAGPQLLALLEPLLPAHLVAAVEAAFRTYGILGESRHRDLSAFTYGQLPGGWTA